LLISWDRHQQHIVGRHPDRGWVMRSQRSGGQYAAGHTTSRKIHPLTTLVTHDRAPGTGADHNHLSSHNVGFAMDAPHVLRTHPMGHPTIMALDR